MKNIGVLLSGCGVYDGSEIHEAVITLLAIDRAGAKAVCMAPDIDFKEVNHLNCSNTGSDRNVLAESARIARGEIKDISQVSVDSLDALILPGGFGAAKNLCDFADKGSESVVHPDVKKLITDLNNANKPIGAICIAPAVLVRALSDKKPKVTIGNDEKTASEIEKCSALHVECKVDEICIDEKNKIVTTPAYMLGPGIKEVASGIEKLVNEVIKLCNA